MRTLTLSHARLSREEEEVLDEEEDGSSSLVPGSHVQHTLTFFGTGGNNRRAIVATSAATPHVDAMARPMSRERAVTLSLTSGPSPRPRTLYSDASQGTSRVA